jgi:NAD(P)H-nitrite reductase large subunit
MSILIIGSGIAAVSALEAIRGREPGTPITLVADEAAPFYYRPMIPLIISGKKSAEDTALVFNPVKRYGIAFIRGMVEFVDTMEKRAVLSDGRTLSYDRLLIASGSRAKLRALHDAGGAGLFTLRTLEDAQRIRQAAEKAKRAVVIGGGFVGVKASEALVSRGLKVTLIEQRDTILHPRTDATASEMVAARLRAAGVELIAGAMPDGTIREKGVLKGVALGSKEIPGDLVVAAIGTSPCLDFVKSCGVECGNGILTNECLETSVPGVFAAGDAVEYRDAATGKPAVSALWSNAVDMGRTAGLNLTGEKKRYDGMLSVKNASEILGLPVVSAGIVDGAKENCTVIASGGKDTYRKVLFDGDRVVGALFVGDLRGSGVITNLIKNRIAGGRGKAVKVMQGA